MIDIVAMPRVALIEIKKVKNISIWSKLKDCYQHLDTASFFKGFFNVKRTF